MVVGSNVMPNMSKKVKICLNFKLINIFSPFRCMYREDIKKLHEFKNSPEMNELERDLIPVKISAKNI